MKVAIRNSKGFRLPIGRDAFFGTIAGDASIVIECTPEQWMALEPTLAPNISVIWVDDGATRVEAPVKPAPVEKVIEKVEPVVAPKGPEEVAPLPVSAPAPEEIPSEEPADESVPEVAELEDEYKGKKRGRKAKN